MYLLSITAKNIVIFTKFSGWEFCGKTQFPQSFGRAETLRFHKISIPGNQVNVTVFFTVNYTVLCLNFCQNNSVVFAKVSVRSIASQLCLKRKSLQLIKENRSVHHSHEHLLAKLAAYGFSIAALRLIHNYLTNREQRTKVNLSYSPWEEILFRVPQGSILGPLSFITFLCDLFLIMNEIS